MNIGGKAYVDHFGISWPAGTHRLFAALSIAKKWKLFKERGDDISADPGDCMEEAVRALFPSAKISPWTSIMIHDYVAHDNYALLGCGACGKSFFEALAAICFYIVDPFDSTCILGSSTLTDLASRAWAPVLQLFTELKNNRLGFEIPGKVMNGIYAIVNARDSELAQTQSQRSGILGRAMDEGRIYGTHNSYIFLGIDELGLIKDIESLKTAVSNIRIGTKVFKFVTAANPLDWSAPQSQFYLPPAGSKVDVNTGSWMSTTGHFCRHLDGRKSPVVINPSLKREYPFLMSQDDIDSALALCAGDERHPRYQKMVVGFPLSSSAEMPTVLDPLVAAANKVGQAPDPIPQGDYARELGMAAGIDPAWSSNGDSATYAGVRVYEHAGRVILDFTGRVSRIPIVADSPHPVTRQLRDGVLNRMRADGGPSIDKVMVDASGNQNLHDSLTLWVGPGCAPVNNSARASDNPIKHLDPRPARETVKDRGTEAWVVLSAFCAAGMVRGLPQAAIDGLTQRRFALRPNSDEPCSPLRLEPKSEFSKRFHGKSPDDTDACALAALAVKERLGVVPFGKAPAPEPSALFPGMRQEAQQFVPTEAPPESAFEDDFSGVGAFE